MKYRNTVEFRVWGDYALFSDPVTRVGGEKTSYHIPTYEALKGIMNSVYWKPTIEWIVDKVRVIKIIQTQTKGMKPIKFDGGNDLSLYTYLRDVEYQVSAHFEWNLNRPDLEHDRNENKHHNVAKRMITRGGRRDIYLGTRECQGYVEPCLFGEGVGFYDNIPEIALGYMFHGFTYPDQTANEEDKKGMSVRFWHPIVKNGILEFPRPEDCTDKRFIKNMNIKPFGKDNFTGLEEFSEEECGE